MKLVRESLDNEFVGKECVFMAPLRTSLQKYDEKIARVISYDYSGYLTIEFENGKKLTNVPLEDVRFIK
jgi:hypothetical protein